MPGRCSRFFLFAQNSFHLLDAALTHLYAISTWRTRTILQIVFAHFLSIFFIFYFQPLITMNDILLVVFIFYGLVDRWNKMQWNRMHTNQPAHSIQFKSSTSSSSFTYFSFLWNLNDFPVASSSVWTCARQVS